MFIRPSVVFTTSRAHLKWSRDGIYIALSKLEWQELIKSVQVCFQRTHSNQLQPIFTLHLCIAFAGGDELENWIVCDLMKTKICWEFGTDSDLWKKRMCMQPELENEIHIWPQGGDIQEGVASQRGDIHGGGVTHPSGWRLVMRVTSPKGVTDQMFLEVWNTRSFIST